MAFRVARVVDAVNHVFVPISWDVKTRTAIVPHDGGCQDGEFAAD
jgi:hypothetical protein